MQEEKRHRAWLRPLAFMSLLFVTLFSTIALLSSGTIESEDGWLYLSVSRNFYYTGELTAAPREYPEKNVNMNSFLDQEGKWRAPGAVGYSLSMLPAVALSDLVLKHYGAQPPVHFPLEHDWTVLFFASFTNVFWISVMGVALYYWARTLELSSRDSLLFTFLTVFTTNLLSMATYGFAQMIFTTFLVICFLLATKFIKTKQWRYFWLLGLAFLCLRYVYNVSYYLAILPLALYIFASLRGKLQRTLILLAVLGSVAFFIWQPVLVWSLIRMPLGIKPVVLFEGVWGFLFSSGKSIFLYSPFLALIPLFWHKLPKKYKNEALAVATLTGLFLLFLGSAALPEKAGPSPIWHGGMSWGPRYAMPLIPFLMLLAFLIWQQLIQWWQKILAVGLLLLGIYIQILGVSLPYLLQYAGIPFSFPIGEQVVSVFDYASFMPRFSPLIKSTKMFAVLAMKLPKTLDNGKYNVTFFDGFDTPLYTPVGIFRGFRHQGYIWYQEPAHQPLKELKLVVDNVPDSTASAAVAQLKINSNNRTIFTQDLPHDTEQTITLSREQLSPTAATNYLTLFAEYEEPTVAPHVIYIKQLLINNQAVNLGSIDYPDVSTLGYKTSPIPYGWFGNQETDPWALWSMRARVNEQIFDFWWLENLYYWDRPRTLITILFFGNLVVCVTSWIGLLSYFKKYDTHL